VQTGILHINRSLGTAPSEQPYLGPAVTLLRSLTNGTDSELEKPTSKNTIKRERLSKLLLVRIGGFCWIDWALTGAVMLLIALIWYVVSYQTSLVVQVATPSLTIVVALLIMLKSARSTNASTERHVHAIQESTRIQIESAMVGFERLGESLENVVDRLGGISSIMQQTASETSKIRQLQERELIGKQEAEEKARLAVQPKVFATLEHTGLWIWRSYQLKIRVEENDVEGAVIRYPHYEPQVYRVIILSMSFDKIAKHMQVTVNCGSASAIDYLCVDGIGLEILLRDLQGRRYSGEINIPLQSRDREVPVPLILSFH